MATTVHTEQSRFTNRILHGDCVDVMRQMQDNSVDFVLTDPPYLVNYHDRDTLCCRWDTSGGKT